MTRPQLRVVRDDTAKPENASDADAARALRDRLRGTLDVFVVNGVAVVVGTVCSLIERSRIRRIADTIPGIREISTRAVTVEPPRVRDPLIARVVRDVLRADPEIADETVSVVAAHGCVTIAGEAEDSREHDRLIDYVERVRGVKSINDEVTVSLARKRRSLKAVQVARRHVRDRFPHQPVEITVFNDTAILSGSVDNERLKAAVQREIEVSLSRRVVNELEVVDARGTFGGG